MGKKKLPQPGPAPHRGRLQAQGPGTEKSVPWNTESAPTKSELLAMLDQLWALLTAAEREERNACYEAAKSYIARAPAQGIDAPFSITFRNRKRRRGVRIDLEIRAGTAGIDDPT
jgi:hypothetical protein